MVHHSTAFAFAPAVFAMLGVSIAQDPEYNLLPSTATHGSVQQNLDTLESPVQLPPHALFRIAPSDAESDQAKGIFHLQWSPDGKLLASRNRRNFVTVYRAADQKKMFEVAGHGNNWIQSLQFSADSKYLVTAAGSGEKVKIWHTANGKLALEIDTIATAAHFANDQQQIIVLGDTHVQCYSWPGGQLVYQHPFQSENQRSLAMSRDGKIVAMFRTINNRFFQPQILNLETKTKIDLDAVVSTPQSAVISPNQSWLAMTLQRESKILLWNLNNPLKSKYVLAGHKDAVESLAFSPDSRLLISTGWDHQTIVWDVLSRQAIGQFSGHTERVNAAAVSPVEFVFVTGASGATDNSIIGWSLREALFPKLEIELPEPTFEQIWNAMGASSVSTSLAATANLIHGLVQNEREFLPKLKQRIAAVTIQFTPTSVAENILKLDDPDFSIRENATLELLKTRSQSETELRAALKQSLSPEVQYRLAKILNVPLVKPKTNFTDRRRWQRIVFALETMATPAAIELLKRMATGHVDPVIISEASDAMGRLSVNGSANKP